MATDELVLTERIAAGDHEAFRVLFERYRAGIYRFCLLMLGDSAAAEDVYQDVFLNFYHACSSGKKMQTVRGYLITSARNRCLNVIRSSRRLVSLDDAFHPTGSMDISAPDVNIHLRKALMEIPDQYREAFLLFELEGYSYEEIAHYLDVSHNVVKNRIYRAKLALQRILRPILRDDYHE